MLRIFLILFAVCIMLPLAVSAETAEIAGGSCGENLTWILTDDGTLTISGEGEMVSGAGQNWTAYCDQITNIVIEQGVTSICNGAFGNAAVQSVSIADSVTYIGDYAFEWCIYLKSISLPDSVRYLGDGVFSYCRSLPEIELPADVEYIGSGPFFACMGLQKIRLDPSNPRYSTDDYGILYNKDQSVLIQAPPALTGHYTMPNTVVSIQEYGLSCGALSSITLSGNLEYIGEYAFYVSDLESIAFPESVRWIGDYAFCDGVFLDEASFYCSNTTIGSGVFAGCVNLRTINFYGDPPQFDAYAFNKLTSTAYYPSDNPKWTNDILQSYGGEITWMTYGLPGGPCGENLTWKLEEDGTLIISGTGPMENYPSTSNSVQWDAPWHDYSERILAVVVEEGVTHIGNHAFRNDYVNVAEIILPDTLESIGEEAFKNCESLSRIVLPKNLTYIGEMAFAYCDALTTVEILGSVEQIDEYAFYQCDLLSSISFGGSLEVLGKCAFLDCSSLRFLEIPEGLTKIGDCVFGSCDLLEEVVIPDTVEKIGNYVFSYCRSLKTITIPAGVTFIDVYTFEQCDALEQVIFQGDAPELGENLFQNTSTTVYYPSGNATWTDAVMQQYGGEITWVPYSTVTEIASGWSGNAQWTLTSDGVLRVYGSGNMKNYEYSGIRPWENYAQQITAVVVESGVTAIGECAFKGLSSLKSVTLPNSGLSRIGEAAFYGCGALKEIYLPDGLYTVNDYTFKNCSGLESVRLPGTLEKIGQGAFENCTALDYIFIPGETEIIGAWSFKGCAALAEAEMTWANATEIREGAFKNCSALTTVHFPGAIQKLGDSAFYGIGAERFTIPATVTEVGPWCFARAYSLAEITFEGDAPTIGEGAFNKITLTACYPGDNATWTAETMQNYGGTVAWTEN